MKFVIQTILLTGAATAQSAAHITTSFALWDGTFGTDKIGFYASVIDVEDSRTALALELDNGTDQRVPYLPNWLPPQMQTFTVGPNLFEQRVHDEAVNIPGMTSDGLDLLYHCDLPASSDPSCTISQGPAFARLNQCQNTAAAYTSYQIQTYTYSGRLSYSGGVETITRTWKNGPNTMGIPSWCSNSSYTPSSGWEYPITFKKEEFRTYQVVITAGQEKLNPTAGASASVSGPTPTGTGAGSQGAAMPMRTAAPVIVGLGAAVAVFL